MAAMLHVVILCVTLLLHHRSYGTQIDQEFEPEQQDFKDTSSTDLDDIVNKTDSAKPTRIKNFKDDGQINDREKFRGINFNEDLEKLLRSLVTVLQDLRNKSRDNLPDDRFKESSYEKMPSSLNSMQLKTNRNKYGDIYEGNNEDKTDIQISSEGYEKERYRGNIEQWIPPSFDPKITTGTNLFQNFNRNPGKIFDDYINSSIINSPRNQAQKVIDNSKNAQTPVLNTKIYRYLSRNPTVEPTDYKPSSLFPTNMQRIRPNEPNPINLNKKPATESYLSLDKKSVIGHYKLPTTFYANVKYTQSNQQEQHNFREVTNPEDRSLIGESDTRKYPKKDSYKDDNEDYKPFIALNANSQNINSNQQNLSNSQKEPTENYHNEDRNGGDISRFKPTGESNVNTQNIPLDDPKQAILNRYSITENNPKGDPNRENIPTDERSSKTNSNSPKINANQPELPNPPDELGSKKGKYEDEINLFKPTDELKTNTKYIESNEPERTNSNPESTREQNSKNNGNGKNAFNGERSSKTNTNSQNVNPNELKLLNPPKELRAKNSKNEHEISLFKPTDEFNVNTKNIESNEPKQIISNKESIPEDYPKNAGNNENTNTKPFRISSAKSQYINPNQSKQSNPPKESKNEKNNSNRELTAEDNLKDGRNENINNDEQSSITNSKPQNISPNQLKFPNPASESTTKNDKNEDEINPSKPTDQLNLNIKNAESNEPKQTNSDRESITEDNPKEDENEENVNNKPFNNINSNSQVINPIQPKLPNSPKESNNEQNNSNIESTTENNTNEGENEENINKDEPFNASNANSQVINPNQLILFNPPKESRAKTDKYEDEISFFEPTRELIINTKNIESNEPKPMSSNRESITEGDSKDDGKEGKIYNDKTFNTSRVKSQNSDPNQPKMSNPSNESTAKNGQKFNKNKDEINISKPNDPQNTQTSEPKLTISNKNTSKGDISNSDFDNRTGDIEYEEDSIDESYDNKKYDKDEDEINISKPTNAQNIQTSEPKLTISNKSSSKGDVSNSDSDNGTSDFEYKEYSSDESYDNENYDNDQRVTNFQDLGDVVSSNSQLLRNLPKAPYKNERNNDENSPIFENNSPTIRSTALDEKFDSAQIVPNIQDFEQEENYKSNESNKDDNQDEDNNQHADNNQDEDNNQHADNNQDEDNNDCHFHFEDDIQNENDSQDEDNNDCHFHFEDDIQNENDNQDEDEQTVINFRHFKDGESENSQQSQNSPLPNEKNPVKDERSHTFENESQTNESTNPEEKLNSAQKVPNLRDSKAIVNENSQQSQNSPTPHEKISVKKGKSPISENEGQTSESTTPKEKQDSAQTTPNLSDSEKVISESSQQLKNSPTPNENSPNIERSSTFKSESQTNESTTPEEKNNSQNVPNFPDSEEAVRENSQQLQNSPIPQENSRIKDERSPTLENKNHTDDLRIPDQNLDSTQVVPNLPDSKVILSENSQQSQKSPTPYESSPVNDEISPTSENESQNGKSKSSQEKHDFSQNAPNYPDSEAVASENFPQLKNSPTPNENNLLKDERSPNSKKEGQTKESEPPGEKIDFKQTGPTFPDFEEVIIRNSQEFQNLPAQNGNNLKKVEPPSSFNQNSEVNDQVTPGEKFGFQQTVQTVPSGNSQLFPNLPLSNGSSPFKEERSLTSKKEYQTNESIKSGEKFDTIVEFLHRYSKNPAFKELKLK